MHGISVSLILFCPNSILSAYRVTNNFHARFSALSRTYIYRLLMGCTHHSEIPVFERDLCWAPPGGWVSSIRPWAALQGEVQRGNFYTWNRIPTSYWRYWTLERAALSYIQWGLRRFLIVQSAVAVVNMLKYSMALGHIHEQLCVPCVEAMSISSDNLANSHSKPILTAGWRDNALIRCRQKCITWQMSQL